MLVCEINENAKCQRAPEWNPSAILQKKYPYLSLEFYNRICLFIIAFIPQSHIANAFVCFGDNPVSYSLGAMYQTDWASPCFDEILKHRETVLLVLTKATDVAYSIETFAKFKHHFI